MLINLLLAISFIVFTLSLLINFQKAVTVSTLLAKRLNRMARKTRLLAETLFRAYSRYKRMQPSQPLRRSRLANQQLA